MLLVSKVLSTDGSGFWSDRVAQVPVTGLDLSYVAHGETFGELRVYFDTDSWDIDDHGLIYTDRRFIKELHDLLRGVNLDPEDVEYSEQGMQGHDYVSLDVGSKFIQSFKALKA